MRFLSGKNRKNLKRMAEKNSNIQEAYNELDRLSADEKKRLEYEARQKAIRDKNILLKTGETRGIEKGTQATLERLILSMLKEQLPLDKISSITGILISIPESLYFYYHMFYRTYILLCVFRIHSFENSLILLFHTQLCRKCFCFFHYNFAECK